MFLMAWNCWKTTTQSAPVIDTAIPEPA
jgi:hypothetical protein